ncbi:MAG: CCA tRNA nucleotidyltransferase [Candidatus Omnitrophica bacterium]|nr:CCA tRNA nucleotidyltransferase [Candidatus Omnitrophota bacterium]
MTKTVSDQRKFALQIVKSLTEAGYTAYFAGGCVRDLVMKVKPKDYDIATTASPDEIEKLFSKSIPVGKQFGVIIVVMNGRHFEVATFRREGPYRDGRHPDEVSFTTPEQDALRRDFTVNGLFYDPMKRRTIDYVGGKNDIRRKVIRTIGNPLARFEEDHLRLLRAIRFAANLGFQIEENTWNAIRELRKTIHSVSQERIRDELVKMFTRSNAGRGLELLSESGLLAEILPEIETMKGVQQPPEFHPEGDVFIHTKMLMDQLEHPSIALAFGALLHDVGKPATFSDEGGRIHFYNHPGIGADISKKLLTRLKFSNREIADIISCVENHMKFANVKEMRIGKLKQFISRDNFPVELEMHRIDCLASHGKLELYRFLERKITEFKREELKPKRLINGDDLIGLGIEPGPIMREILEEVYSLQLEDKIKTCDQALEWVKNHYIKNQGANKQK